MKDEFYASVLITLLSLAVVVGVIGFSDKIGGLQYQLKLCEQRQMLTHGVQVVTDGGVLLLTPENVRDFMR